MAEPVAAELRQRRREITMIFQQFNLLMQRSCLKNICFPMELAGVKKEEAEKRAKELLETGPREYDRLPDGGPYDGHPCWQA